MRLLVAKVAWLTGAFKTLQEAEAHTCTCAELVYRNNYDGSRDYKLKGDLRCQKCRGTGAHQICANCSGTGMIPGSKVCETCFGSGAVPFERMADRRIA